MKSAPAFSVNDRVYHAVFGLGTISAMNSRHTTIVFDENGTKKFVASMVRIEHSDTPAPSKPVRAKRTRKAG